MCACVLAHIDGVWICACVCMAFSMACACNTTCGAYACAHICTYAHPCFWCVPEWRCCDCFLTARKFALTYPHILWSNVRRSRTFLHFIENQLRETRKKENFSCGRTVGFSNPLKFPEPYICINNQQQYWLLCFFCALDDITVCALICTGAGRRLRTASTECTCTREVFIDLAAGKEGWMCLCRGYTSIWYPWFSHITRVDQNRIYRPYMTVYLVVSLPKIPFMHRISGLFSSFFGEQEFDNIRESSRTLELLELFKGFDVQFWETGPWDPPPTFKTSQIVVYAYK